MFEGIAPSLAMPATKSHDVLSEVLRHGAPRLLGQAIEAEVQDWLESHKHILDPNGHRQVVGNGRLPTRSIVTGLGAVEVRQRRIHDRRIVGENDRGEPVDADGQAMLRMHQRVQTKAKSMLHAIWMAPTRADGHKAFDAFAEMFEAKYPAAVECLKKDRNVRLTFYDFPRPSTCSALQRLGER